MTRFDQTGVTLTKHQNNAALGVNILPDAEMRAYGFTDHAPEEWYLCRKVSEDGTTTLNLTIAKDGSDWVIDVLDEYFLQPYDYQGLLERNPDNGYARAVADECERQYRLLPDAGTYRCTITDSKDESAVRDVRLVVTADGKVGLYGVDGKALLANGKDE